MLRAPSTSSTHRLAGQATTPHPRLPVRPWGTLPDNAAHNSPVVLEVPTTVAVLMDLLAIREDHASYANAVKLIQDAADGAVVRLEPHVPVTRLQLHCGDVTHGAEMSFPHVVISVDGAGPAHGYASRAALADRAFQQRLQAHYADIPGGVVASPDSPAGWELGTLLQEISQYADAPQLRGAPRCDTRPEALYPAEWATSWYQRAVPAA